MIYNPPAAKAMPAPNATNAAAELNNCLLLADVFCPTVFVAFPTPNNLPANPLIPFPANCVIAELNASIPGATAFTALNAIYAAKSFGRFWIKNAILSELSSRNPANVFSASPAVPMTSPKLLTLSVDPNAPFKSARDFPIAEKASPKAAPTSEATSFTSSQYGFILSIPDVSLSAIFCPSSSPTLSTSPLIASIPTFDSTSKAGCSLLDRVSVRPSIA